MVFPRFRVDEVNRATLVVDGLGGKAQNVARVLTQLRARAVLLQFFGGPRGQWMAEQLRRQRVRVEPIEVKAESRLCASILDQSSGEITELVEESGPSSPAEYKRLFSAYKSLLPQAKAVVLAGTLARGGPVDFYARCVAAARKKGILTVVDAQGDPLACALEERPDLVKPNRHELERSLGRALPNEEDIWAGIEDIRSKGAGSVVITDGARVALAASPRGRWRITPPRVKAVNSVGSGDSFTAAMVVSLLRGEDFGVACRAGAASGAANALQLMTGEIELAAFQTLIKKVKVARL
jgi:tagatose 6-phosphate kinase